MITPREVKRISSSQMKIVWPDSSIAEISSLKLRRNCPCAACAEKRGELNHSKPLSSRASDSKVLLKKSMLTIVDSSIAEETNLLEIWAVGNYAIGCRWGDGHATGIYTFEKLKAIANQDPETGS